jgi:hypothetical protein
MNKIFRIICALLFGFSLRWVNDHLGPNWYNLYLDLVILILSIGLFWKKTVWVVAASSVTVIFLYLLDHQFSVYDNGYMKPMYLFLLAFVNYLFFNDSKSKNHQESKYMMKNNFRVIGALLFIFSLGWVNAYLGPNWYNLYLDLVILILPIVLFWKKAVGMVAASSITIVLLYLLDYQFSVYDNSYIKTTYLLLLTLGYCLFFNDSKGKNHQESAS